MKTSYFSFALLLVPTLLIAGVKSGLQKGEFAPAFEPHHVTGPDKNTDTCPVCKYGMTPAAQVWVNGDDWSNVAKIATQLEASIDKAGAQKLKGFVVVVEPMSFDKKTLEGKLQKLATDNKLQNVALTYLTKDSSAVEEYGINLSGDVKNTVMVYSNRQIVKNFVNLKATDENLRSLNSAVQTALSAHKG